MQPVQGHKIQMANLVLGSLFFWNSLNRSLSLFQGLTLFNKLLKYQNAILLVFNSEAHF